MENKKHFEDICYQTNDLMADAMKWKCIANHSESESERSLAKEMAENLYAMYKKGNEMLLKKFME